MPAFRYPYNAVFPVATAAAGGFVSIRSKDGNWCPVAWQGFICRHGTALIQGRYCKLQAFNVTKDDGSFGSEWVTLKKSEFVLGWAVEAAKWGQKRLELGAYAIIDDTGTPIVIDDDRTGKPRNELEHKAPVVPIEFARRTA